MSYQYSEVQPENFNSAGYQEFNNIDFLLNFEGRSLISGSVKIQARMELLQNNDVYTSQDVQIDHEVGAHAFFSDVTCSFQNVGQLESISEYPRLIKTHAIGSKSRSDYANADMVCELRNLTDQVSSNVSQGYDPTGDTSAVDQPFNRTDFSIKPHCVVNRMFNSETGARAAIPFAKSGAVRISLRCARNFAVLFGSQVDNNTSYRLYDVKVCYATVGDDGSRPNLEGMVSSTIKSSMNSGMANIAAKVPLVARGFSTTFLRQDEEFKPLVNNLAAALVPGLNRLQFLYNDATNALVTYQIVDQQEIAQRFIDSLDRSSHNSLSMWNQCTSNSYGVGLDLGAYVDMRNQSVNINMESEVTNAEPMIVFIYFHGKINM